MISFLFSFNYDRVKCANFLFCSFKYIKEIVKETQDIDLLIKNTAMYQKYFANCCMLGKFHYGCLNNIIKLL